MLLVQEHDIVYWQIGNAVVGNEYTFPIKQTSKKRRTGKSYAGAIAPVLVEDNTKS